MKVLFDHQIFSSQISGGVSRYFYELQKALNLHGVDSELGFSWTINQYLLAEAKGRPHALWGNKVWKGKAHLVRFLNQGQMRRRIRRPDYDLFHPTYYDPYFIRDLKRPFVVTVHDMIHELFGQGFSDTKKVLRNKKILCQKAAAVITVSEKTRVDLLEVLAVPEKKVHVIHHGNSLSPTRIIPREVSVPGSYVLFVGQRQGYKNWKTFMEGFALIAKKFHALHAVMVGGKLDQQEVEFLQSLDCLDRVILKSGVQDDELAFLYSKAAFFVFPSLYEGFGLPIIEAMSWGCPVLAAQASCFPEIAQKAALYFDPRDSGDLAQKMVQLLSDQELEKTLRQAGLVRAAGFNWDQCAQKTAEVYSSI